MKHSRVAAVKDAGSIEGEVKILSRSLLELGMLLSEDQRSCLYKYAAHVLEWNRRINLISRRDERSLVGSHIRESLSVPHLVTIAEGATLMDLGSGAGLPGIPIKIVRPDLSVVLVESKRKRALFLRETVQVLNLSRVEIVQERVETLRPGGVPYNVVVVRGVAELRKLWQWSCPLLADEGVLVALKGGRIEAELAALRTVDPHLHITQIPLPEVFASPQKGRIIITVQHGERN